MRFFGIEIQGFWIRTVAFEGVVLLKIGVTRFAPHKARTLIAWNELTFDERVVLHRKVATSSCENAAGARATRSLVRTPYILFHTPYTLHPTPYTLHPTPYTLHPAPYAGEGADRLRFEVVRVLSNVIIVL